ncbi:hypothetical protein GCM10022232_38600 [Streptomyces plumbiresistens]|uniref:MFS transporter n=1 Tax=Streptomyces plumbiresistens TaxID=511811 RepID=A0ABP7RI03_9ACTN
MGGGLAVAEEVAKDPAAGPQQAQVLVDAVLQAFAHGVAQTSMVGGIVMAAGALIVLAVLHGRSGAGKRRPEGSAVGGADAKEVIHTDVR